MSAELTPELADLFEDHMCRTFGLILVPKDLAPIRLASSIIFDGARLLGIKNLPSSEAFTKYTFTTTGPILFVPPNYRRAFSPLVRAVLFTHEPTHCLQFFADLRMAIWYIAHREARAAYEAEAFGAGDEVEFLLTGRIAESVAAMVHPARESYALEEGDLSLLGGLREQRVTSIVNGVIATTCGREAVKWLYRNAPQCCNEVAVAAIRLGSPGLLEAA